MLRRRSRHDDDEYFQIPSTMPCPAWCDLPQSHPYEPPSLVDGSLFRRHSRTLAGDLVTGTTVFDQKGKTFLALTAWAWLADQDATVEQVGVIQPDASVAGLTLQSSAPSDGDHVPLRPDAVRPAAAFLSAGLAAGADELEQIAEALR
jgi:hypothetical protein